MKRVKYWLFELFYRIFPKRRPVSGPHAMLISDDVMNAIWKISAVPLPFKDNRGKTSE